MKISNQSWLTPGRKDRNHFQNTISRIQNRISKKNKSRTFWKSIVKLRISVWTVWTACIVFWLTGIKMDPPRRRNRNLKNWSTWSIEPASKSILLSKRNCWSFETVFRPLEDPASSSDPLACTCVMFYFEIAISTITAQKATNLHPNWWFCRYNILSLIFCSFSAGPVNNS